MVTAGWATSASMKTRPSRKGRGGKAAGAKVVGGNFAFLDPCGNHIEIVEYRDVQYSKLEGVLRSMALALDKSEDARK